jgi:hypothetical protein
MLRFLFILRTAGRPMDKEMLGIAGQWLLTKHSRA